MTTTATPTTSFDWPDFDRRYRALLDQPLDAAGVPAWLTRWSDLEREFLEAFTDVNRAKDEDTTDEAAQAEYLRFVTELQPQKQPVGQALKDKLLAVQDLEPGPDQAQMMRRLRNEADLYREENVRLEADIAARANEYRKMTGAWTVTLDGRDMTFAEAGTRLLENDRAAREQAWRAMAERRLQDAERLDALFLELLLQRRQVARNAGLKDYREYSWRSKSRFDYSPDDALRFHDAIAAELTPLVARLDAARRRQMGVELLRPWDQTVDPRGREPLRPFTSPEQLEQAGARIFASVDPLFGQQFERLRARPGERGYLDLGARKGKASGARCGFYPVRGIPYIFMNAAGTQSDVNTLLHEAGHAFHGYASHAAQDLVWNRQAPMEFNEVASMAMELLAAPYLTRERGGLYDDPADAARANAEELANAISFLPYMAIVDGFQHWIYAEAPENVSGDDLAARWSELWLHYRPEVDWTGLERERDRLWHRQLHIFLYPFYYVEYGMAQLGAFQVWRNSLADHPAALARYREALSLGGSRSLPELYETAGANFNFERPALAEIGRLVESHLGEALA